MPELQAQGIPQATGRPFPWYCPRCRKREVRPATIPYRTERLFEGRLVAVEVPNLVVPQCTNCGELVFNYAADEQILNAVKAQAHNRIREFTDTEENKPMSRISQIPDPRHEQEDLFTVRTITGDEAGGGGGRFRSVEEFAEAFKKLFLMFGDAEQISIEGDRVIWKGKKAVGIITTLRGKIAVYTLTDSGFSLNESLTKLYNEPSDN